MALAECLAADDGEVVLVAGTHQRRVAALVGPVEIAAAGFLLARCAGPDKYFPVIHEIMASQGEIFGGTPPRSVLLRIAGGAGLSEDQFKACVTDRDATAALDKRVKAGLDAGVTGTPTFFVNGEKVADSSLAALSEKIDAALAAS